MFQFSSVQFSHSVVSDSLWPHEPQYARPPCPSPTPGVYPNSCPLSQWCHPTISSSAVPFSSWPQSFPASGSFQMSQFFASGGQSIGVSASTSVLPRNTQDWSSLGWTGWLSLQSKGLSRVFSQHHSSKASILQVTVNLQVSCLSGQKGLVVCLVETPHHTLHKRMPLLWPMWLCSRGRLWFTI